jgi:hypothetical protein
VDLEELNKSPFGRSLHVLAHRLPRDCREGHDWELERGFHLEVLGENTFSLILASPEASDDPSPHLLSNTHRKGQDRFVIWHCPGEYQPEKFQDFADLLAERSGIGLILSQTTERAQALLDYPKYRGLWKQTQQPVLQIFQDLPDSRFFTVEKCLFSLGRIGRRLVKMGRLRRLMPW